MQKTVLALLIFTLAPPGWAQSAQNSWDSLRRLRVGQKIQILHMSGKSSQGQFVQYSEQAISIRSGPDQLSVPRTAVFSVRTLGGSHRLRNTLLGLGMGAAAGLAIGAVKGATYHEAGETGVFVLVWTPIGAGIGAGVGAALPASGPTVYRAERRVGAAAEIDAAGGKQCEDE